MLLFSTEHLQPATAFSRYNSPLEETNIEYRDTRRERVRRYQIRV